MIFVLFALAFSDECAVLIDAGSSGSRFWVYSWTENSSAWQNDVPSDLIAENSYKVTPGISQWFNDTDAMQMEFHTAMDLVVGYAQKEGDCQNISEIGMWLMSTAGLRTESADEVNEILIAIAEWFETNGPFDWQYARLLSGEEEATYAWIGTNYVLGLWGESDKIGILEMGGQSLQVAFEPSNGIIMDDSFDVELFGNTYRIYANSWNGFGMSATLDNIDKMVQTDEGSKFLDRKDLEYSHPCLPAGWSNDLTSDFDWPLPGHYVSNNCTRLLEYYFEQYSVSEVCDYDVCSLAGAYISGMENIDFYSLSSFYRTADAVNRLDESVGYSPSLSSLSKAIEAMCELNVTELAEQMEGYYAKYDVNICYKSKIVYQILMMLPNLGVSATVTYGSAENANGVEGSWLVGALIEIMHSTAIVDADIAENGTNTDPGDVEVVDAENGTNTETIDVEVVDADNRTNTEAAGVEIIDGNDNKFLPYFLIFLVAFVIAAISFCYVYASRSKVNAHDAPPEQTELLPEQQPKQEI